MTHVASQTNAIAVQLDAPAAITRVVPVEVERLSRPRRAEIRFAVRRLKTLSPVFSDAVDVSSSGCRLESYAALTEASRYIFRFSYGSRFLSLPGRVVWCSIDRFESTPRGSRAVYQTGVELEPGEHGNIWRAALARYAGVSLGA